MRNNFYEKGIVLKRDNISRARIVIGFNNWKQYANNAYALCYTSMHDESNDATYLKLNLSALMERCKLEELHRCSALFSHITEEQSHDIPSHRMRI